jgi:hypothetical protein
VKLEAAGCLCTNNPYSIISQKTGICISTTVRTSDVICLRHCNVLVYKDLAFHETWFIMFIILVPVNSISDHMLFCIMIQGMIF